MKKAEKMLFRERVFRKKFLQKSFFLMLSFCMIVSLTTGIFSLKAAGKQNGAQNNIQNSSQNTIQSTVQSSAQSTSQTEAHPSRLVDDAGLLSQDEARELQDTLDRVSEEQQCDVVIVTVQSLRGQYIVNYADDYFDYNGYGMGNGRDGVLFLIAMNEREWAISTRGFGITAFTDAGQEYITDRLMSDLSNGEYKQAFSIFAEEAENFLEQARKGKPYDKGNLPGELMKNIALAAMVGLIGGLIIALLSVAGMKKAMRPVYAQPAAMNYLVRDSCHMWERRERLLRKTVNKIHIPKNHSGGGGGGGSSIHMGSSGASHGGSHGRF